MIKLIALLTMLIDHIGAVLFPELVFFRTIGRLSMPLFAYCIARGFYYSKQHGTIRKYIRNMVIFAFVSQLPYDILPFEGLNIGFTWLIALLLLVICTAKYKAVWQKIFVFVAAFATVYVSIRSGVLPVDAGIYGILIALLFYFLISTKKENLTSYFLVLVLTWIYFACTQENAVIQIVSVFSAFVLALCRKYDSLVKLPKWASYVFYPAHMVILWALGCV